MAEAVRLDSRANKRNSSLCVCVCVKKLRNGQTKMQAKSCWCCCCCSRSWARCCHIVVAMVATAAGYSIFVSCIFTFSQFCGAAAARKQSTATNWARHGARQTGVRHGGPPWDVGCNKCRPAQSRPDQARPDQARPGHRIASHRSVAKAMFALPMHCATPTTTPYAHHCCMQMRHVAHLTPTTLWQQVNETSEALYESALPSPMHWKKTIDYWLTESWMRYLVLSKGLKLLDLVIILY